MVGTAHAMFTTRVNRTQRRRKQLRREGKVMAGVDEEKPCVDEALRKNRVHQRPKTKGHGLASDCRLRKRRMRDATIDRRNLSYRRRL